MAEADIIRGERLYNAYCSVCLGIFVRFEGALTDLRLIGEERHAIFNPVVLEGVLSGTGLASSADVLAQEDMARIQSYARHRAHEDRGGRFWQQGNAAL